MNHLSPTNLSIISFILFFYFLPSKITAQTDTTLQYFLDSNYVYLDDTGNFGIQDSSLVELINTVDSNYIQIDSNGMLVTLDSLIQSLLDSNAIVQIDANDNFVNVLFVDSLGNFVVNDSTMQMLLDSSFVYIDSSGYITFTNSTLINIINGNFSPPDTLVNNVLNQDSTLIQDGILANTGAVDDINDEFLSNDSTLWKQFNNGIFTITSNGNLEVDSSSLNIFNSLDLFDINSSGDISNVDNNFPDDIGTSNGALLNQLILKFGYDRTRAEHYGLIFEPKNAYFFSASGLMKKQDDLIGIYFQGGLSATKFEEDNLDPATSINNDIKINLVLADFNISPFVGFNVGGNYLFTSTGFYSSILIPKFKHDTPSTEDNIGNSTAYGSQVMVGALFDRLFIEFSGRFGKVSKSPYNHKGLSGSLDYALSEHLILHVSYKYEQFARDYNKTISTLRLGLGYGF